MLEAGKMPVYDSEQWNERIQDDAVHTKSVPMTAAMNLTLNRITHGWFTKRAKQQKSNK
jgi:hypothetical protein